MSLRGPCPATSGCRVKRLPKPVPTSLWLLFLTRVGFTPGEAEHLLQTKHGCRAVARSQERKRIWQTHLGQEYKSLLARALHLDQIGYRAGGTRFSPSHPNP